MAWTNLEPILHREGLVRDAPQLVERLRAIVAAPDSATRRNALDAAAGVLGADGHAARLLCVLAADAHSEPRRIALELSVRLPGLPVPVLIAWLRPLLRDRRIPTKVRLQAAVALCRASKADANKVLRDFASGFGKVRFLERRRSLRKRFAGRKKVFDRFTVRLAARMPFVCPRCRVKLPRAAMSRHLWERHRLLLAGRRVRSPWRLIDHWASSPGGSPIKAHRQLLRHGGGDEDSRNALRRDATRRQAGLCPHCFAAIPLDPAAFPVAADLAGLSLSHGRLSGHGFALELTRSLLGERLRIATPEGVVFDGLEPNPRGKAHKLSRLSLLLVAVLAVVLAATPPPIWALPVTIATLLLTVWLAILLRSGEPDDRPDRIVDHAWQKLVPHLHVGDHESANAAFLSALAVTSLRLGDPLARERTLKRMVAATRAALDKSSARPVHLIALQRLQIADADASGGDPVLVAADAVGPCLTGRLTPAAAELILAGDLTARWSPGQKARLRVLLAARAFAAGMGVWDLDALGRAAPALGRALNVEDTDGLARLRLLWDLRANRPWRHCGPAATVFELAKYAMLGGQHLEAAPDLLLFQPLPAGGEPIHLLACGRGLIVGGALIHEWPTEISTRPLPGSKGGGYELRFGGAPGRRVDSLQVRGNVDELVAKLKTWGSYFFEEFLPWIGNALTRPGDGAADRLRPLTINCPECGTAFLGHRGDLGRPIFAESSRPISQKSP